MRKLNKQRMYSYLGQHVTDVVDFLAYFSHLISGPNLILTHFADNFFDVLGRSVDLGLLFLYRRSDCGCLVLNFLEECLCGVELSIESVSILFIC